MGPGLVVNVVRFKIGVVPRSIFVLACRAEWGYGNYWLQQDEADVKSALILQTALRPAVLYLTSCVCLRCVIAD